MKTIKKMPFRKIIEGIVLFAVAIIALLVLLSFLKVGGLRMYAVKSGSMEPQIKKGSVVFTQPAEEYKVGDIITFQISNGTDFVTHRVSEVGKDADKVYYKTKGDANSSEDFAKVTEDKVVGKVTLNINYVGYFIQYVKTLPGLVILIIIPATVIIYEEFKKIKKEAKEIIKKRRAKKKNSKKSSKNSESEKPKKLTPNNLKPKKGGGTNAAKDKKDN